MIVDQPEVIIIGAGHNGLVAAAYLARAGKRTLILEANSEIGGATSSVRAFPGFDARISRYSYLVSLLPDAIVTDLGLNFECLSRKISSYTPFEEDGDSKGVLISRHWDDQTQRSFEALDATGNEARAWQRFYGEIAKFAAVIAPTLLQPLMTRSELKSFIGMPEIWDYLIESPIGRIITERFQSDVVRGLVLTDGLIGSFASADEIQSNICFLYHLMGNGTGEWKVPRGGMGELVSELERVARAAGVQIELNSRVVKVHSNDDLVTVVTQNGGEFVAPYLLSNLAPQTLAALRGTKPPQSLDGSQLKVNILLKRLPKLKSGVDPRLAFAGTFHANEGFAQLERVYRQAKKGEMSDVLPIEMYCHTLTDPTILSPELIAAGFHTLTIFALHTPAQLFDADNESARSAGLKAVLNSLNQYLAEPIEELIAGIEVKTPLDIEAEIGLPRGNIFHRDLQFPFREDATAPSWGVETDDPRIFICGAGAVRGGGVSGIPGHNAAMALLSKD